MFNLLIHFEYESHVELVTNMNISINKWIWIKTMTSRLKYFCLHLESSPAY